MGVVYYCARVAYHRARVLYHRPRVATRGKHRSTPSGLGGIFAFFIVPELQLGATIIQPLRGCPFRTPTGFNNNNPTCKRGDDDIKHTHDDIQHTHNYFL